MAVANLNINAGQKGTVNQQGLNPGWTVQEDATATDMLDSSGSTGQVSATFKKVPQAGVGGKPSDAPIKSSTYLLDQTADFLHPDLGYIHGNIAQVSEDGNNVQIELDSIMNSLNADISAAPFIDGAAFYSWKQTNLPTISGMAVAPDGFLWLAGRTTQVSKFDRFGGTRLDFINTGSNVKKVVFDSAGLLYGLGNLNIYKIDTIAKTSTTIVTAAAGSFVDFTIDSANNLYVATTDLTSGAAIKKYSTAGTLLTGWGNNNLSLGSDTPSQFQTITGIGAQFGGGNSVYVTSSTPLNISGALSASVQTFSNTGTYVSTNNLSLNLDFNNIWMEPVPNRTGSAYSMLTVTAQGINLGSVPDSASNIINRDFRAPRSAINSPPYGDMAIASDRNGMGIYVAVNDTVTRLAGGKLSPYQALECYIGLTGFTSVRDGAIKYTNTTSAQRNVFDGYFPAWEGNAWTYIKQLAASRKFFLTSSGYNINVTDWTGTLLKINVDNRLGPIKRVEETATGRQINVTNLNAIASRAIYTATANDSIITADYNEINTTTIAVQSYPVAIDPIPNIQGTVMPSNSAGYMIADSSNPPQLLSAGEFVNAGGSVVATVSETLGSIDITMIGPKSPIAGFTAPFSIATSLGGQKLAALRVSGNAVNVNPQVLPVLTGADISVTSQTNTADLSSPFINNGSIAYTAAHEAACRIGSAEITLSFDIPRRTIHTFGTIAGSYFIYNRLKWRVVSAQIQGDAISITAKRFTSVLDTTPNPTITVATHDALWNGFRVQDNFLSPGIATA